MKKCINCGTSLSDGDLFCSHCGKKQSSTERKSNQTKCPNCGELIDSFKAYCPACGYELRNTESSESVKDFFSKVENIENNRSFKKPKFLSNITKSMGLDSSDDKLITLIQSYSIPNNKEDILEFFILASSNVIPSSYGVDKNNLSMKNRSDAWLSKLEQAKIKADIMFNHDDAEYLQICEIYKKVQDDIRISKIKLHAYWVVPLLLFMLMYLIIFLAVDPIKTLSVLGILLIIVLLCSLLIVFVYKKFKK